MDLIVLTAFIILQTYKKIITKIYKNLVKYKKYAQYKNEKFNL